MDAKTLERIEARLAVARGSTLEDYEQFNANAPTDVRRLCSTVREQAQRIERLERALTDLIERGYEPVEHGSCSLDDDPNGHHALLCAKAALRGDA
jgi:predicted GNAT superfamily acetyltransferase